jgi:hypothetical protein
MSLVVDLPPDVETELAAEAARLRLPLGEYAARLLATGRGVAPRPSNGVELVAYWQSAGLVGSRTDIVDAPDHARALRRQAEARERS